MDWFERLTGFREDGYERTRERLQVQGGRLHSLVNGCSYGIGELELLPLQALREHHLNSAGASVPVLFATNRQPTGSDNPFYYYGNALIDRPDRNNLRRGIAVVRVPPERERGEVSRPSWVAVTLERVTSHPLAKTLHILRHTLAGRLLDTGGTLKEVADVLRHRHLDTTLIYAKVDMNRLGAVAMPWPGSTA